MCAGAPQGETVSAVPHVLWSILAQRQSNDECRADIVLSLSRRPASATCVLSIPKLVRQVRAR